MNHAGRFVSLRAPLAFLALLCALIMLTQIGAGDADANGRDKGNVKIKVLTKSQSMLLRRDRLVVRVKVNGGAPKVKLAARHAGKKKFFKSRKVIIRGQKAARSVRLKLTRAGKRELASCGTKKIKVSGRYADGGETRKLKSSRKLRQDASRCAGPYAPVPTDNADRCDFLDPRVCLQPFPNDYFTKDDPSSATGKRLNLNRESMPANTKGVHIDPTDMNRADGFSPGNMIIVKVPRVDTPAAFENSGLVPINNLGAYDDPEQAVIVINAETGERQPIWAELDANPTAVDPSEDGPGGINENPGNTGPVNLLIRPAENFDFGERYIVALRNLRDSSDEPVPAPVGFRVYRDNDVTDQPEVESRRPHMESIINDLTTKAGVDRDSLYMAWDFTVASQESVTGRAVTIRDDAFAELGDTNLANRTIEGDAPNYTINSTTENPDAETRRRVEGTVEVPCYLDENGCPTGSEFAHDASGAITWNEEFTTDVPFRCIIPNSVEDEDPGSITPAAPGIYGHGLLGNRNQVNGQRVLANQSNTMWCAMDFQGFSDGDIGPVIASLSDMSNFNQLVDRMQQGFVNFLYLGRALNHPDGMSTEPEFQINPGSGSESVIATDGVDGRTNYMGVSQGAIMGGPVTALSPDADLGVLNVTGMNYSTLLRRSVDSDEYFKLPGLGLYANYPSELERPLLLSLVQLLWDRGEGNGYAHNLTTDPLPNTQPHEVLLQAALGDHQVANIAAEVQARTVGASVYSPALEPGRHWETDPFLGIPEVTEFPYTGGSMLVYYDGGPVGFVGDRDGGTATPPNENVPPRPEWGFGDDPHGYPRAAPDGLNQETSFLQGNGVPACADPDGYCFANGWTGAP